MNKGSWRDDLAKLTENFHEQAKVDRLEAIERDNALAEELGFEPELDPKRGHGYCRFRRDNVHVWETASNGKVWWMRAKLIDGHYTDQTFFETQEDALKNQNPYAKLGKYGSFVRTEKQA